MALVLVGFGDHDLVDLMEDEKNSEFLMTAPLKNIPHYREEKSCSIAQVEAFVNYTMWMSEKIEEYDKGEK